MNKEDNDVLAASVSYANMYMFASVRKKSKKYITKTPNSARCHAFFPKDAQSLHTCSPRVLKASRAACERVWSMRHVWARIRARGVKFVYASARLVLLDTIKKKGRYALNECLIHGYRANTQSSEWVLYDIAEL